MAADATDALLNFVALGFYYRMQRHRPISREEGERKRFIIIKKLVALALLTTFAGIGIYTTWKWLAGLQTEPPCEAFYTILIFTDVLIVLVASASA